MSTHRASSVRRRLTIWISVALALILVPLTAANVVVERALVRDLQAATGSSLVEHLAGMPELRSGAAAARRHLAALAPALAATGASLEIVPAAARADAAVLAERRLDLDDGSHLLRYRAAAPWLSRAATRAVALHLLAGAVALGVLVAGVEWILRTRLVAPLGRIAHQVRFMGKGGGWTPSLPEADDELRDVERALSELGPALSAQVHAWIEGERRAAVAAALAAVRARLDGPQRRALALAGDLQARGAVVPDAKCRLRALVREVERLSHATRDLERETFAPAPIADGGRDAG